MEKNITASTRKVPPNLQSLKGFAGGAAANLVKFNQRMAELNAERVLEFTKIKSQVGQVGGDNAQVEKNYSEWSREHTVETDVERWKMVRELDSARLSVNAAKDFLTNPLALAQGYEISNPIRHGLAATLSGLGPAALKNLAARAIAADGDGNSKIELAALIVENDKTPTKSRGFSSSEAAESGFGADAKMAKQLIEDVEWAAESSMVQTRIFEGRAINKLVLAMRFPGRTLPREPESIGADKKPTGYAARKAMQDADAENE